MVTSERARSQKRRNLGSLLALALICAAPLAGCARGPSEPTWAAYGGDPAKGRVLIVRYNCGSCHVIGGVANADGKVGPPLVHFADRTVIAGILPNTPPNLMRWLENPQAVLPGNAMPDVGVDQAQARDMAAYLYRGR
jgi:cytochrome c2